MRDNKDGAKRQLWQFGLRTRAPEKAAQGRRMGARVKKFAERFYKSKAWQDARDSYIASVGGLCEKCKERGEIVAAEIVHHKIKLTAKNINDPAVTLNPKNLEAVCRTCHGQAHSHGRRYRVDKWGNVIV